MNDSFSDLTLMHVGFELAVRDGANVHPHESAQSEPEQNENNGHVPERELPVRRNRRQSAALAVFIRSIVRPLVGARTLRVHRGAIYVIGEQGKMGLSPRAQIF
jgi:hypothetical protein